MKQTKNRYRPAMTLASDKTKKREKQGIKQTVFLVSKSLPRQLFTTIAMIMTYYFCISEICLVFAFFCLLEYLTIYLSMIISIYLWIYLSIYEYIYLSMNISIYECIYLFMNISIYLSLLPRSWWFFIWRLKTQKYVFNPEN